MRRRALPVSLACLLASPAHAAGGHHSIDDATILDPGQCQVETWFERTRDGAARVWHLGPACRVGAVELGLNVDALRVSDGGRVDVAGIQAKWAHPLNDALSIGAVVSSTPGPAATSSAAISPPPSTFNGLRCSTKATCRQELAPSSPVLS